MSGRREVAIGLGAYAGYLLVRRLVWHERGRERALRNARRVAAFERRCHLDIEPRVQHVALRLPRLVRVLNAGYVVGNVGLSVAWLLRLYARGDQSFRAERFAAVSAFVGALPAFAMFPTAPPRMLDGFVDTMGAPGTGLDHPLIVRFYNPLAAVPSIHVAFAVVTGVGLSRRARGPIGRMGWRSYPVVVALVVIATANHFVVDVVGGAALGAAARRATRILSR